MSSELKSDARRRPFSKTAASSPPAAKLSAGMAVFIGQLTLRDAFTVNPHPAFWDFLVAMPIS